MLVERIPPIAHKRLFIVHMNDPLLRTAFLLGEIDSHLLAACDDDHRLSGVITKTDMVRNPGNCSGSSCRKIVAATMNENVISCEPGTDRIELPTRGLSARQP